MTQGSNNSENPSFPIWRKLFSQQVSGLSWSKVCAASQIIAEAKTNLASRFVGIISEISGVSARYDDTQQRIILDIPHTQQTHFLPVESGVIVRKSNQTIIDPFHADFPNVLRQACTSKGMNDYENHIQRLFDGHESSLVQD